MRVRRVVVLFLGLAAGCQSPQLVLPGTPVPPACTLAGFEQAPGKVLAPLKARPSVRSKSEPEPIAQRYPFGHGPADIGEWVDAGPEWKTWRYWIRTETGKSLAIRVEPLSLPPAAEMWVCSPDRTMRHGPLRGRGLGDVGRYWSPHVPGAELWIEVLAPANAVGQVQAVITDVFAGYP